MKHKHGFVLISVLLITTISSIVALSAVKENKLQERVGGNLQKELNARMNAEKGIFNSFAYIESRHKTKVPHQEIKDTLIEYIATFEIGNNISILNPHVNDEGVFTFVSQGTYQGAVAHLKAEVLTSQNTGGDGVTKVITGCEGVTLSGSGVIDSYDSRISDYNVTPTGGKLNKNGNADVTTLGIQSVDGEGNVTYQGADITLNGDSVIKGSAAASGNFVVGESSSGHVVGDVRANQDVIFNGMDLSSTGTHMITGDVAVGGDAQINSNTIGGTVNVVGEASNTSNVDGMVSYGANGSVSGFENLNVQDNNIKSPNVAMGNCDKKEHMPDLITKITAIEAPAVYSGMVRQETNLDSTEEMVFSARTGEADVFSADTTDSTLAKLDATEMQLLNEPKTVFTFDEFTLRSRMITIEGHVTIVVKGDFNTIGDSPGFQLADDDSSLTVVVEGQVNIGSDSRIFEGANVVAGSDKIPFSIYSTYDSKENAEQKAVTFNGATDTYAYIYAPLGDVLTEASGSLMGAIHGRNVEISGAGSVHYDEALEEIGQDPDAPRTAQFISVSYYYM